MAASSAFSHALQNVQLLVLGLIFLPLDTFVLYLSYIARFLFTSGQEANRRHVRSTNTPYFQPRTVLVTGVGMSKGLSLARIFYAAGHNVIGADFEPAYLPVNAGRMSRSLKSFQRLTKPDGTREGSARYAQSILDIVRREKADLWVSCSGVASAVEDGQAKEMIELVTKCKAVQFDVPVTKRLHEKHSFIEYTQSLGLPVPETHTIQTKTAVLKLLEDAQITGKKFILKFIGTDDTVRGDMTLLPRPTSTETKDHISRLQISPERPWILQQYIRGPEYCTHALVVRGEVKAFVACPSAELLMYYTALSPSSALSKNMIRFTQEHASAAGSDFTGHLSFDFLVDETEAVAAAKDDNKAVTLYPIECNPRAHTAVVLFNNTPAMVEDGYMALLEDSKAIKPGFTGKEYGMNGVTTLPPVYPYQPAKYYWIGHDLVSLVLIPLLSLLSKDGPSLVEVFDSIGTFVDHLLWWKDGTFEVWDPLPAWWLYHVYWPWQFLTSLLTGWHWSRLNVSTCKMFECE